MVQTQRLKCTPKAVLQVKEEGHQSYQIADERKWFAELLHHQLVNIPVTFGIGRENITAIVLVLPPEILDMIQL